MYVRLSCGHICRDCLDYHNCYKKTHPKCGWHLGGCPDKKARKKGLLLFPCFASILVARFRFNHAITDTPNSFAGIRISFIILLDALKTIGSPGICRLGQLKHPASWSGQLLASWPLKYEMAIFGLLGSYCINQSNKSFFNAYSF